jgi:hypothetical protein
MLNFDVLQSTLQTLNQHFKIVADKSVNQLMTMRNWLFGLYIVEFQQNGADRAAYGERLLEKLAESLNIPGFSFRNLKLGRQCLPNSTRRPTKSLVASRFNTSPFC